MDFSFFIGPLIGGIIGLITNGIAIRMLFRPLNPVFFMGIKLPFTPGLIPKEKSRIAKSLGNVVGNTLVNESVIKRGLLSPEMDKKIHDGLTAFIDEHRDSEITVHELILAFIGQQENDAIINVSKEKITSISYKKIKSLDLGTQLSEIAIEEIIVNLEGSMFSMFINDSLIEMVKTKIAEIINQMIYTKGEALIRSIVEDEVDNLLEIKMKDLIEEYDYLLPKIKIEIVKLIHHLVNANLGKIMSAIDIESLVEEKINEFDVLELEKIILEIMSKELKAIIWLGGLLGALMGLIMSFI
ncbi:MAG: DUF445 domain-containing protein [Eubacteriaceae bacterium]